jgi:outer membrane protein assembly factor BamD (BamD/ComL family)
MEERILKTRLRQWFGIRIIIASSLPVGVWAQVAPAPAVPTSTPVPAQASVPAVNNAANPGPSLEETYRNALQAFGKGDYSSASTGFASVISQAAPDANLESVYYMLAASYLRSEAFAQAKDVVKTFLSKYPASPNRFEALSSLGYAAYRSGDYAQAIEAFKQMEQVPKLRDRALIGEAQANLDGGQNDEAVSVLRLLVGSGINTPLQAEGALLLVKAYIKSGAYEKAVSTLQQLRANADKINNIMRLNQTAFKLGDGLVDQKKPELALQAYQIVLPKKRVIELQQARLQDMKNAVASNLDAMRADPSRVPELVNQNTMLNENIKQAEAMLSQFLTTPDFSPSYLLRLARAYSLNQQPWEALSIYGEFLRRYPDDPSREEALFGIIVESAGVNRIEETRKYAEIYLREFPNHPNADTVGYLLGSTSLVADDPQAAETYFGRMLIEQPDSKYREQLRFMLGNARFSLGKYNLAASDYQRYLADFPGGQFSEEALYRIALCALFGDDNNRAETLIKDYLQKYPNGVFVSDAKYRIGVCKFSETDYPETVKVCDEWLKTYGEDSLLAEVIALKADALAEEGQIPEAIQLYLRAYQIAKSEGVVSYVAFQAKKLLQKKGDWEQIEKLFENFVEKHPNNPGLLAAVVTAAQAKARLGRVEEARTFVADAILLTINDQNRENVEELLSELAKLCLKKDSSTIGMDPQAHMEGLLGDATLSTSPVAHARLLYGQSEMAKMRRDDAGSRDAMQQIVDQFKPDQLSPGLLALGGDFLLAQGKLDKAESCYKRLTLKYPKSLYREYAEVGLGEIEFARQHYSKALPHFQAAIDRASAAMKLKEATLGKAQTLLALGRLDEAQALFEAVASNREWRGEATACSMYSLGEIQRREGELHEAISTFQRVCLAYAKYPSWVAKAYAAQASCYEQLGNISQARAVYEEFLKNEKLSPFQEYGNARKRIEDLNRG